MRAERRLKTLAAALLLLTAFHGPLRAEPSEIDKVPEYGLEPRELDYAVVIGVEKYRGENIPPSDYSAGDAKLMRDYLIALGYRATNIKFLTNDFATRDDIAAAVDSWLPRRVKPESKVFFYYSGHGAPDLSTPDKPEAYLVPYNGDPNDLAYTGYSVAGLKTKLGKLKVAEVIVVLDSCFSGTGKHSLLAQGARPLMNQFTAVGELSANMALLTASRANEISTSDPETGHGVMTYHFLKALRDGKTSLADIFKTIKPRVEDDAKKIQGGDQTPEFLVGDATRRDGFILADPELILAAKKRLDETNSDKAKLQRMEQQRAEAQQRAEEAQRQAEAAQRQAEARLQEERYRMEREHAAQQEQLQEERRRIRQQKRSAPAEDPVFVPPTF